MLPSSSDAEGPAAAPRTSALLLDGAPLRNAYDVAKFFGIDHGTMVWVLYTAPENARYKSFEIPKRSGGMRRIDSPTGLIREMQRKLAPILADAYDVHPSAHGFLKERGVLTNAKGHTGQRQVLNIDLEDFFPSINFGRVRGLFMAPPFACGPGAATVLAQVCTLRNGLPQGAPTSPALSNFIAATLDRRLTRLAKDQNLRYSRYADDITFSTNQPVFPPAVAVKVQADGASLAVRPGEALERAVSAAGFTINLRKVRLQSKSVRQNVTGLTVNETANVERKRIRRVRAMVHAWEKFGLDAAGVEHFMQHRGKKPKTGKGPQSPGAAFRNVVYGQLAYIKMVRGPADPVFLKLCARVLDIDPNPSKFIKQMVFGADDFEIFISHASEDKALIAKPIYEACGRLGLKAFLDEPHIGWGESFTKKINTALGAARTVLAVVSSSSVTKEWPVLEMNTALAMEVNGSKRVVPVIVGKPDLSKLPLLQGKNHIVWANNPDQVALKLLDIVRPPPKPKAAPAPPPAPQRLFGSRAPSTAVPTTPPLPPLFRPYSNGAPPRSGQKRGRSVFEWIFGRKPRA